jgi:hypothetical protein
MPDVIAVSLFRCALGTVMRNVLVTYSIMPHVPSRQEPITSTYRKVTRPGHPEAAATSPCVSTYHKLLIDRRVIDDSGRASFVLACIDACLACFKNKMDTNPFAAAAYLPDSNLTLLAVETHKIL